MSFYGRHYGLSLAVKIPPTMTTGAAVRTTSFTKGAATPAPPTHLTAQTASLEQVADAFEWYGLKVRPPGGYADGATLVALENHIADLLNLSPTSDKIAAQQQAVTDAQTAVTNAQRALANEQQNLQTALSTGTQYIPTGGVTVADARQYLSDAQSKADAAQSTANAYHAAQLGNQTTVMNLALAHSSRIAQALQASGEVPPPAPIPEANLPPGMSSQQYGATGGPQAESFMDQYGTLVIAGGAGVAMLTLGYLLLKKPKTKMAGYRRRRSKR